MQIKYNDNEQRFIEQSKDGCIEKNNIILFSDDDIGKQYGIAFEILDPIKADMFISNLFRGTDDIRESSGIRVTEIQFKPRNQEDIDAVRIEINEVLNKYL